MSSVLWGQLICEVMRDLGWFQLNPKEQWETAIQLLGVLGAGTLGLWTVNQWFLSKKIQFEHDVLSRIDSLYKAWQDRLSRYQSPSFTTEDQEKGDTISVMETLLKIMQEDSDFVVENQLSFRELRQLNKSYFGVEQTRILRAIERNMVENKGIGGLLSQARHAYEQAKSRRNSKRGFFRSLFR